MIKPNLLKLQAYSGLAAVLVVYVGIIYALHRAGMGFIDLRPISYLGKNPVTAKLFSGTLLASSVLFINFSFYIRRAFHPGTRFMTYFLIGQAAQIIAALVPLGTHGHIHTIAGFTLGFSFPLIIWQFTRSHKGSSHYGLYRSLLVFELVSFALGISIFIFTKGIAPLSEALAAIGFHIWVLVLSVISEA